MIDARPRRPLAATTLRRRATALLLTTLLGLALAAPASASTLAVTSGSTSVAPATTSSTASAMAAEVLSWLNRDRVAAGLRVLRPWPALASLAAQRAANMAASHTLSHQAAGGDPGAALTAHGIQWYSYGEIIGMSTYPWGDSAAANIYGMWMNSPLHHAIMFSASYNYIGIGFVEAADGSTWASILFTESVDHTRPWAANNSLTYSGTTLRFSWRGDDYLLQTHTAGLRGFNVLYRVDYGTWRLLRSNTTAHVLYLYGRAHRHYYSFRVQSSDWRGNLSAWTPIKRIWLP